MIALPNASLSIPPEDTGSSGEVQRSECVLGFIPVIYYSALLCVGMPVNILTAVALSRLAARTKKSSYLYLLALTGSDILTQLFIVFVGFLLETAIFHREVPELLLHSVSVMEFAANHASIWATVTLTVDRYMALCHPLRHRQISFPERARKIIAAVFTLALASGVPFYWWSDMWRVSHPPTALDRVLIWTHCTIIYFLPCSIFLVLNSLIIYRLKIRHRKQCHEECQQPATKRLGKTTAILLHLAYDLANMLAMLNTAVNFFLYCFVSKLFRAAVRDVLYLRGGPLPPHHPLTHQHAPSNASNCSSSCSMTGKQRDLTPVPPKRAAIRL
ncbi:GP142 protein, partial [Amia calva]|nr:GP142 protein [Amia calva]